MPSPPCLPACLQVQQGKRYRMRVIQAGASWAIKLNITQHTLDVIALDGLPTRRTPATAFIANPGESRFLLPCGGFLLCLCALNPKPCSFKPWVLCPNPKAL